MEELTFLSIYQLFQFIKIILETEGLENAHLHIYKQQSDLLMVLKGLNVYSDHSRKFTI